MEKEEEFVPMELRPGLETFKNLPNRFVTLIWKIIGWKGVFVSLTVVMIWAGKIPAAAVPYVWGFTILVILFDKQGLQFIKDLKK
ncbi:MAG: hypothetical protein K9M94_03645 [Spirochaetia bacterium]|nr:hypothetical protein [Spirochaetia bacterium]